MALKIGKVYRFKDGIDNKYFSFEYTQGCFIGYAKNEWPRFMLNVEKRTECMVNARDENFVEVITLEIPPQPPDKEVKWVELPERFERIPSSCLFPSEEILINQLISAVRQLQELEKLRQTTRS